MSLPSTPKERALFAAATKITVGNGQTARFWTDRWLNGMSPQDLAPQLFKIAIRKNRTVKDALSNGKWLQDLRFSLDESHSTELLRLEELLNDIQLSDVRDEIAWSFGSKNYYTARSAYQLQFIGAVQTDLQKIVWKGWAPARCKFFIWTLMLDSVLTADKLMLRHCKNEYFCPLCRRNLETDEHLLIECPFSLKVWSHVAACLNQQVLGPETWQMEQHNIKSWYRKVVGLQAKDTRQITFPLANMICWKIWNERNRRIFNKKDLPVHAFIYKIMDEIDVWRLAGAPLPLVVQTSGAPFDPG
jgi:hypothetical protein